MHRIRSLALVIFALLAVTFAVAAQPAVPPENDPHAGRPPPRPAVGDATARAGQLFESIRADDPERARDFFFPRDPFLILKGIADPARYWNVLWTHYVADIHALHASLPDLRDATFGTLTLSRRGGWVERRQEANALPYWASRHSMVTYRGGGRERRFEIRTLINWGPRWYVTHLR